MSDHQPVLLKETIDLLAIKPDGIYVDLTFGRGGHSRAILDKLSFEGTLIAFDVDAEAIEEGKALEELGKRFILIRENFQNFFSVLQDRGVKEVDGILADLGVSSPQFDEGERGFSYRMDAPLDMRMDQRNPLTAAKILSSYPEEEIARILYEYGEEKDSRRIAHLIAEERTKKRIETTGELVDVIKRAKRAKSLFQKGHPAKQTFQALRIAVNGELTALEKMLEDLPKALSLHGRAAIITFHSLEDRMVKRKFRSLTTVEGSRYHPVAEEAKFSDLTRKPIIATNEELLQNHRAHSAKLRAIERSKP